MRKRSTQWLLLSWAVFFVLTPVLTGCSSDDNKNPLVAVTLLQTTDMHNAASGVGSFDAYDPMNTTDSDTVLGG